MALPIYIELDININQLKEPVLIKQYNTGEQELIITVTESGKKYILDNNIHTCTFKMLTPDNREIFNDSVINDDGTASIIITSNYTAISGTGLAELNIFNSSNFSRVSTMSFYVNIKKSVYPDEDILGTNEYTALTNTMLNSSLSIHEMEDLINSVNEAESKRVLDEGTRCLNEDNRVESENERVQSESIRKTDEETRQINEFGESLDGLSSGRVYNENQRITNELIREKNEHGEKLDDTGGRVYAESQRVEAENQRVVNELERQNYMSNTVQPAVSTINQKITLVNDTISTCQQATSNANTATETANNAASLANSAKDATVTATSNANTATETANQTIARMQELIADLENKVIYCC